MHEPDQRYPPEPIIKAEKQPVVVAVGQPSRAYGADEIEHADQGKEARRSHNWKSEISAEGHEVRGGQSIGRHAANEECQREYPENRALRCNAKCSEADGRKTSSGCHRDRWNGSLPVRREPDVLRAILGKQLIQDEREEQANSGRNKRCPPSPIVGNPSSQRHEDECTRRERSIDQPDDKSSARREPAGRDHGTELQCDEAGRDPEQDPHAEPHLGAAPHDGGE